MKTIVQRGTSGNPGKAFENTVAAAAKWGKYRIHFYPLPRDNRIALILEHFGGRLMDALKIRVELRKMGRRDLLKLVTNQKISDCLIGDAACRFHLRYKKFAYCVSEIMGESCQAEKLEKLEEVCQGPEKINHFPPFVEGIEEEFIGTEKKTAEFKVYYKGDPTHSAVFLGKVMERRGKERGNNLKDLLKKAIIDFSDRVRDPSAVFLLGS